MLRHPLAAALSLLALLPMGAEAQRLPVRRLAIVGGELDESARLQALEGDSAASATVTLRAPSRALSPGSASMAVLAPELFVGRNSALPWGFNDGPLWQGRGLNVAVTAGIAANWGPVRIIAAPQYIESENLPYQVFPYPQDRPEHRSTFANPFYPPPASIDLPLRPGDRRIRRLVPGQSTLVVSGRGVEAGVSTENAWWGPGIQDALVLGSQAAGFPNAFVRTAKPSRTRLGLVDSWLLVGSLHDSPWFSANEGSSARGVAAFAATLRPAAAPRLELGLARLVISAEGPSLGLAFAPFGSVGRPNGPDSLSPGNRDQVTSLWARWSVPGFEAYTEWSRFEEPASLRDMLESPGHSQGYTLGLQWVHPVAEARVRLGGEATYVEPSPSLRLRPVGTSYTSRSVPAGFTNLGQPLAAGTGPGSSSQWLWGDWYRGPLRAGGFMARVRWNNAVLYTPVVPPEKREDISLVWGLRGAGEWKGVRMLATWSHEVRLNYLFQAYYTDIVAGRTAGIDIVNNALTLTLSAPLGRAR